MGGSQGRHAGLPLRGVEAASGRAGIWPANRTVGWEGFQALRQARGDVVGARGDVTWALRIPASYSLILYGIALAVAANTQVNEVESNGKVW